MFSVRELLISNISDDYKEALGFRPRYNYAGMNLVELKRLADETRRYADEIIYYNAEWDRYAEDIKEREEQEKWNHIDDIYSQNNWN